MVDLEMTWDALCPIPHSQPMLPVQLAAPELYSFITSQ